MFRRHASDTNWVKAEGLVVAVDRQDWGNAGGPNIEAGAILGWAVDVRPRDGEPFRAKVEPPMRNLGLTQVEKSDFKNPYPGQVVSVEYDPASHKVRFDTSDPELSVKTSRKARNEASHARFEEALNAPPSADDAAQPDAFADGTGASSNPKADLARTLIARARRKGDTAEVERLTAISAELEHGDTSGPTPE